MATARPWFSSGVRLYSAALKCNRSLFLRMAFRLSSFRLPCHHFVQKTRGRSLYTPVWAKPTDFTEIVVSKDMFFDHIPTKTIPHFKRTLELLLEEAGEVSADVGSGGAPVGFSAPDHVE